MATKLPGVPFSGLRIFLVDDEDSIAWAIEQELKGLGAEVRRAASVKQALELFPNFHADLTISDLNLPDGHGLELLKRWRKEEPTMPVIDPPDASSDTVRLYVIVRELPAWEGP